MNQEGDHKACPNSCPHWLDFWMSSSIARSLWDIHVLQLYFQPLWVVDHNYSLFSRLLIARSFWNNLKMTLTLHNSVRSVRLLYTPHNTGHKTHLSIALEICSWKLHLIILTIRDLWLISSIYVCNYIHCTSDELLCN